MIDSVFLAYVLERYIREDPAYKIKNLCHVALADLKHEVSHYKVFYLLGSKCLEQLANRERKLV